MKVTIKDIAQKTGLSAATVSRVLSGNGYVKEETREKVEAAAGELGYKPHKPFRGGGFDTVVLALVDDVTNPFYAEIIRGLDETLAPHSLRVLICNSEGITAKEEDYIAFANANGMYGVVMVTATETQNLVELLDRTSIPVIMVNRTLRSRDCDAVCIDNYRGGYLATKYLVDMGHTKIHHLTGPMKSTASNDRYRGYLDALNDSGVAFSLDMVYDGNLKKDKGREYADRIVDGKLDCTAVFCGNDIMARALIDRLEKRGVHVPGDISVIAFDETQDAVQGGIGITNVSKNPHDMGVATGNLLLERVLQQDSEPRKVIFAPQLNERESVRRLEE